MVWFRLNCVKCYLKRFRVSNFTNSWKGGEMRFLDMKENAGESFFYIYNIKLIDNSPGFLKWMGYMKKQIAYLNFIKFPIKGFSLILT